MKIKKNEIIFASVAEGLSDDDNTMPKPQRFYIPNWFKKVKPVNSGENFDYISKTKTVRKCPSFVEVWLWSSVTTGPFCVSMVLSVPS